MTRNEQLRARRIERVCELLVDVLLAAVFVGLVLLVGAR